MFIRAEDQGEWDRSDLIEVSLTERDLPITELGNPIVPMWEITPGKTSRRTQTGNGVVFLLASVIFGSILLVGIILLVIWCKKRNSFSSN
jgi:hypothetical protein